jgi:hypothetical protein
VRGANRSVEMSAAFRGPSSSNGFGELIHLRESPSEVSPALGRGEPICRACVRPSDSFNYRTCAMRLVETPSSKNMQKLAYSFDSLENEGQSDQCHGIGIGGVEESMDSRNLTNFARSSGLLKMSAPLPALRC